MRLVVKPLILNMNRRFVRVAISISGLHLLLWLACFGVLKATGFRLVTFESLLGLAAQPRSSFLQDAVFGLMGSISYPVALLGRTWGDAPLLDALLLISNSIIWGIFVAIAACAWRRRIAGLWLNYGLHWTAR